jgi:hypothetical protein
LAGSVGASSSLTWAFSLRFPASDSASLLLSFFSFSLLTFGDDDEEDDERAAPALAVAGAPALPFTLATRLSAAG